MDATRKAIEGLIATTRMLLLYILEQYDAPSGRGPHPLDVVAVIENEVGEIRARLEHQQAKQVLEVE